MDIVHCVDFAKSQVSSRNKHSRTQERSRGTAPLETTRPVVRLYCLFLSGWLAAIRAVISRALLLEQVKSQDRQSCGAHLCRPNQHSSLRAFGDAIPGSTQGEEALDVSAIILRTTPHVIPISVGSEGNGDVMKLAVPQNAINPQL